MTERKIRKTHWIAACAAVAALYAAGAALAVTSSEHGNPIRSWTSTAGVRVPLLAAALRPKYPYSVVAGGVYSPAELDQAIRKDALVREHFAGFNVKQSHLVRLTEDHYGYISYRLNNQVFWTRRRLRLPKGEVLLTDGSHYARCRCANRISETVQLKLANVEPLEALLERPSITLDNLPEFDFAEPPELADTPVLPLQLDLLRQFDPDSLQDSSDARIKLKNPKPQTHSRLWMAALPLAAVPFLIPHHHTGSTPSNSLVPNGNGNPNTDPNPPVIPPLSPVPEPAELCAILIAIAGLMGAKTIAVLRRRARVTKGGNPLPPSLEL